MKFIADNGFQTPTWLIDTDILRKIEPNGEVTRIVNAQSALITQFAQRRQADAAHRERSAGEESVRGRTRSTEMLSDLRHGVFTEIYGSGAGEDRRLSPRRCSARICTDVGNKINPPAAGAAAGGRGGGGGGGRGGARAGGEHRRDQGDAARRAEDSSTPSWRRRRSARPTCRPSGTSTTRVSRSATSSSRRRRRALARRTRKESTRWP